MSKIKVMDDLDALLADLQSSSESHLKHQEQAPVLKQNGIHPNSDPYNNRPVTPIDANIINTMPGATSTPLSHLTSSHSATIIDNSSRESTPPPVPPHPAPELLNQSQDSSDTVTSPAVARKPATLPKPQILSPKGGAAITSNLSELDALLNDLSNAQFLDEIDEKNSVNISHRLSNPRSSVSSGGQTRSVDSLLVDLEHAMVNPSPQSANNNTYKGGEESLYEMISPRQEANTGSLNQSTGQTSMATAELDDLMSSLSQFKMADSNSHRESPYARIPAFSTNAMNAQPSADADEEEMSHDSKALEMMLGNLSTDMSRQGISTVPKGHCAACMKPIVGQVVTALGKIWHPEHLVCVSCGNELGTQNFYERENLPYCEKDYHLLFSPKCAACNGPILDKCVTAFDASWHPEHFTCTSCQRPLGEDGFHAKDGKPYCREDFLEMFAPKCGGCRHPIMDSYISALNRQWHPECFVCQVCHQPFGTGSFFDHEGMPYCETHYHAQRGSLCASCNKPITGRCITAMYKKFHPEHFLCAFCLKQLNKGTFKEQNDKPYCDHCFNKLFG